MKLSAAAVLLSISSASAFSVSYLNQLSTNTAAAPSGSGMTSYLDGISGAEQVPALVTALEQAAPAAPAPVAPAPAAGDYLSALGGASTAVSGAGITSYLDTVASNTATSGGAGLTGYLDALPATAAPVSGGGMTSYLDTMGGGAPVKVAAPAAPAPVAAAPAAPAPVAPAPVAAVAPVAATAPAAGDYLSTLNTGAAQTAGAGITSYLDTVASNTATSGGAGLTGYLDALGSTATATSGAGLTGYLDALATNSEIAGPAGGSSLTSFLETVYSQIMSLPEDGSRKVAGNTVTFAKAEGSYAMSFVKK